MFRPKTAAHRQPIVNRSTSRPTQRNALWSSHRLVFWLTASFCAGILLAHALVIPTAAGPAGTVILLVAWKALRGTRLEAGIILLAVLLLGLLLTERSLNPPEALHHIVHFSDGRVQRLEGRLRNLVRTTDNRSRFLLEVERIFQGNSAAAVTGRVLVTVGEGHVTAKEGQLLRARVRLRAPRNFGCPGEFDYTGHLAFQGVFATAFAPQAAHIVPILEPNRTGPSFLSNLREVIAERITQNVATEEAGLVQALLIGRRQEVTPKQRRLLSEGGVSHLFAISGLHFGMLGLLLYLGTKALYCRSSRLLLWCPPRRILPLLLLLPLGCYLLLTGNALPTRRAFYMAAAGGLLYSINRRTSPMHLLAGAALVILLAQPLALLRPSFQLSFAGLAGILYWLPAWQRPLASAPVQVRWPALLFLTTLAASLATAPLVLWHFHLFAPACLLTNLAATPIIAWGALPTGLTGILLLPIAPGYADLCFCGAGAFVALALALVEAICRIPGMAACYYFPGWLDMLALAVLGSALFLHSRNRPFLLMRGFLLITGVLLLLHRPSGEPCLQVTALSVGQGDATLLSLPGNQHYLVDGGGLPGGRFDTGERLVAPALGRMHVRSLQGVILTHDHPDHRDGLRYILEHFKVGRFYSGIPRDSLDQIIRDTLQQRKIPITHLPQGWTKLPSPPECDLQVFTPDQSRRDKNERSLIVSAGLHQDGVLLTGDMGPEGLRQLLAAGLPNPVTLLKVPHHGSRKPSPVDYLSFLKPQLAFISAGRDNSYHLPAQRTVDLYMDAGIPLHRTDRNGTLTFRSRGRGWQTETLQKGFSIDGN